ncbi:MAG TPA: hypothetical protein VLE99_00860 [Candidatus Saccharimonadales bacterium]|nr:hypothetical protein [Candidatus Saccharimonadales bacterium]
MTDPKRPDDGFGDDREDDDRDPAAGSPYADPGYGTSPAGAPDPSFEWPPGYAPPSYSSSPWTPAGYAAEPDDGLSRTEARALLDALMQLRRGMVASIDLLDNRIDVLAQQIGVSPASIARVGISRRDEDPIPVERPAPPARNAPLGLGLGRTAAARPVDDPPADEPSSNRRRRGTGNL